MAFVKYSEALAAGWAASDDERGEYARTKATAATQKWDSPGEANMLIRRFNAGSDRPTAHVPKGRMNASNVMRSWLFSNLWLWRWQQFCRPFGT
jgi:hypothetical protein